jgi:hypothetical protein
MSSRVLNCAFGLRAKYSLSASSFNAGSPARFASSALKSGMTMGSTTIAPAAFSSAMFFSNTASTFLKSSDPGSDAWPTDSRRIPMRAPLRPLDSRNRV